MADHGDQSAAGFFGKLRREFVPLLLELVELHLHQSVMRQRVIERPEKLRAQALPAHLEDGLETLRLRFEPPDVRLGKFDHAPTLATALQPTRQKNRQRDAEAGGIHAFKPVAPCDGLPAGFGIDSGNDDSRDAGGGAPDNLLIVRREIRVGAMRLRVEKCWRRLQVADGLLTYRRAD